jgi:S-sulfo-L-cysteine synthase (O-acetyl-L-serine-dependent)
VQAIAGKHSLMNTKSAGLLELIGNTPLFELRFPSAELNGVEIYAKAEHLNPSGSVKDRAAKAMILAGIKSGALAGDKTILDATSGNTGIAYAMIGAYLGYKVALCLPKNANLERKRILRAYGAEIIETDPLQGSDGAFLAAREMVHKNPDRYFYPDQYNNSENWRAHYTSTAPEIWNQTNGRISHFIAGMGTCGTFVGTSKRLKEFSSAIRTIAMQPDSPFHGLEGMKHMASTIVPGIFDRSVADAEIQVSTESAHEMALELARTKGLFVGISSGGNVRAALKLARTLPPGSVIVTVLCDSGLRYLSDELWDQK